MSDHQYYRISWADFHRDAQALGWKLKNQHPWEGIVAITRGGLVPGAILARELNVRHVDTVCVSSYDDQDQRVTPEIIKSVSGDGKNWLVVDDLVDTGVTVQVVKKMLPKAHYAALYAKPQGKPTIDTFVTEVSQDTWIVFPWEEATTNA